MNQLKTLNAFTSIGAFIVMVYAVACYYDRIELATALIQLLVLTAISCIVCLEYLNRTKETYGND